MAAGHSLEIHDMIEDAVAQLHEVLQIAIGWDDEHLHRFDAELLAEEPIKTSSAWSMPWNLTLCAACGIARLFCWDLPERCVVPNSSHSIPVT